MKIVMDLVINHTSDEHEWFIKSKSSKENNPYRDFYIWKPPKGNKEPNNWTSFFSGPAWEFDKNTSEYYLHLFSKRQPDLNWENPQVRAELKKIVEFWLSKGVDGWRLDAINVISKVQDYKDCPKKGFGVYFNGPRFVEFMKELNRDVLDKYNVFTIGEMPETLPHHGEAYTDELNGFVSMLLHFELMSVDGGKTKWDLKQWKLSDIKNIMSLWQTSIIKGWNTLYLENHDQPRSVSRFGDDSKFRIESSKMLATWLHMMKGTPFVYQGEEIGMTNVKFGSIEEYNDIETLNKYKDALAKGVPKEKIMNAIHAKSRDNARTPMQWDSSENAGFTKEGKPWLKVNPNYTDINVEKALADPNSIFYYYQKLIQLRKQHLVVVYGTYKMIMEEHPKIYAYTRTLGNEQLLVVSNFYGESTTFSLEEPIITHSQVELLISNYEVDSKGDYKQFEMRPYEVRVYKFTNN